MTLFRLDASLRTEGSVSRQVANTVEAAWQARRPGDPVTRRDVASTPLPSDAWPLAVAAGQTPRDALSDGHRNATALAAGLVDELANADAYLFAVPLYNFGVPQGLKTWVDLVITDPRMAPGTTPAVTGRPAVLVVARGGGYGPGTPREGWDHGTPWVRRILADVFGFELKVVEAELTLAPMRPELEALRPLAEASLQDAVARAEQLGTDLVDQAAAPSAA